MLVLLATLFWYYRIQMKLGCVLVALGLGMTLVEMVCIRYGMWKYGYLNKDGLLVPFWLPVAWTIVSLFVLRVVAFFCDAIIYI